MGTFSHFLFPKHELHILFRLEIRQEPATELTALVCLRKMLGNHLAAYWNKNYRKKKKKKKGRFSPALCSPPALLGTTGRSPPSRPTSELRPARARSACVMPNPQARAGPPRSPQSCVTASDAQEGAVRVTEDGGRAGPTRPGARVSRRLRCPRRLSRAVCSAAHDERDSPRPPPPAPPCPRLQGQQQRTFWGQMASLRP